MILCGGDALIDFVPADIAGETAFIPRMGGAVLNAATALARLGEDVAFIGAASRDLFGDMIAAHMAREGIDASRLARTDADSTLAFVTLDGGEARYAFYDSTSAGRLWTGAEDVPQARALHIGSVTLIAEPSASAYERLARQMRADAVISLDPNCRPGLIDDRGAYVERQTRLAQMSHIVRFSEEDFAYLFGDADERDVALRLIRATSGLVLISRGPNGATAYSNAGAVDIAARSVALKDTIGAGDTFHAGALGWLSRNGKLTTGALAALSAEDLRQMLAFATAAAALSCTRAGCDPPSGADVLRLLAE